MNTYLGIDVHATQSTIAVLYEGAKSPPFVPCEAVPKRSRKPCARPWSRLTWCTRRPSSATVSRQQIQNRLPVVLHCRRSYSFDLQ